MNSVFFIASKTIGMAARAETWLIVLLALSLLALLRGKVWRATALIFICFVAVVALTVFPLGNDLIAPLENQHASRPAIDRVDTIIVLGGDEALGPYRRWGGIQVNDAAERLIEGLALAQRYPQAKLIYTGGIGELGANSGQDDPSRMMVKAWVDLGIDPQRIVVESASRNTAENASMTYDLYQPVAGEVHLLVTSAAHMPRALRSFERAGWTGVVPWPVDYRSVPSTWASTWALDGHLAVLNSALREYIGLWAYGLAGK